MAGDLRIGILGGTFNPIHIGHLYIADVTAQMLDLSFVLFVVASLPPHKDPGLMTSFDHRLEMVRRAIDHHPLFQVSDVESRRRGPSFTVDTLRHYQREYGPEAELFFLTGLDAVLDIDSWKNYKELFDLARFVVLARPGGGPEDLAVKLNRSVDSGYNWSVKDGVFRCPDKKTVHYLDIPSLDISSTHIRKRLARGLTVRYLIPESVREFIVEQGLYQGPEKRR